jgi:hypothetical protein
MDESACIECRCGKLWSFVWKLDHWDVKCWVPEFAPEPKNYIHGGENPFSLTSNVQTEDAAADFKRRRDAGEFGARNEAEYQEIISAAQAEQMDEEFGAHDLG